MGERGPAPKKASQRRRRNKPKPEETIKASPVKPSGVKAPKPSKDWHQFAKHWYESLIASAQSAEFEPSDWQFAFVTAENLSRELELTDGPMPSTSIAAFQKACTMLMSSPADRRRLGVELRGEKKDDAVDDNVVYLKGLRDSL